MVVTEVNPSGGLTRNACRNDDEVGACESLLHALVRGQEAIDFLLSSS